MAGKIKIGRIDAYSNCIKLAFTNFTFNDTDGSEVNRIFLLDECTIVCSKCGDELSDIYSNIIFQLFNKGFLPVDFSSYCCLCYEKENSK